MNKKLPRIFKGEISNTINNNRNVYYLKSDDDDFSFSTRKTQNTSNISIDDKISNIFTSGRHSFNVNVIIKTKDNTYDTNIAGKIRDCIVTLDNHVIPISDIVDIEEKKG